ncbi:exonuclease domain-containing protein [Cytobacillus luteolus]|nr:exonuclease domain-containing protein [Cytobacillus luteolus]MBP1941107.1 DNA polymerase-3 subunit epsilon [Cytobacillus luteolus]
MRNQVVQFMKQLSGMLHPSLFASVSNQNNAANIAFLRQLQRELKAEDVLQVPFSDLKVVVFDLETTGFYPQKGDRILSIGAVKVVGDQLKDSDVFYSLVNNINPLPDTIKELTGICEDDLEHAPELGTVLREFYQFTQTVPLIAHHATHEKNFMHHASWSTLKMNFQHRVIDTSFLTKIVEPAKSLVSLDECCNHFGIQITKRHHALHDAIATAKLWTKSIQLIQEHGFHTLSDVYTHLANR